MCDDELIRNRKEKQEYLTSWLMDASHVQQIAPRVQLELEKAEWEIKAIQNRPKNSKEDLLKPLSNQFDEELHIMMRTLPKIPAFDMGGFTSSDAISASASMSVYEYVTAVGDINTPETTEYSNYYSELYNNIQLIQNRPRDIQKLLRILPNKGTLARFERAYTAYLNFKSGLGEKTSAAIEMRTFLDGLIGDLKGLSKKWESENTPSWEEMSRRLYKGIDVDYEYQELLRQKSIYSKLIDKLSCVGKDREGPSKTKLEYIWTELLDHVFTILNIIDLQTNDK